MSSVTAVTVTTSDKDLWYLTYFISMQAFNLHILCYSIHMLSIIHMFIKCLLQIHRIDLRTHAHRSSVSYLLCA